jgi:hypothetical protein
VEHGGFDPLPARHIELLGRACQGVPGELATAAPGDSGGLGLTHFDWLLLHLLLHSSAIRPRAGSIPDLASEERVQSIHCLPLQSVGHRLIPSSHAVVGVPHHFHDDALRRASRQEQASKVVAQTMERVAAQISLATWSKYR